MSSTGDALRIVKYNGAGNDFIVVDGRDDLPDDLSPVARALCRRAHSVGGDGLILVEPLEPERDGDPHVRMALWNADGSRPAISGNAARCACRHAVEERLAPTELILDTDIGPVRGRVDDRQVSVRLPGTAIVRTDRRIRVEGRDVVGCHVDVGVPFFVLFHDDPDDLPVRYLGRTIRNHRAFPDGANVDFVRVDDEQSLYLRIYERGVEAETLSSGTGCISAALAAAALDRAHGPVSCVTRGGTLTIRFRQLQGSELEEALELVDGDAGGSDGQGEGEDTEVGSDEPPETEAAASAEDPPPDPDRDADVEEDDPDRSGTVGDESGQEAPAGGERTAFSDLQVEGPTSRVFRGEIHPDALAGC